MSNKKLFYKKPFNVSSKCNKLEDIHLFGFWIYLLSDCILFATLFATYAVLKDNVANGPTGKDIFKVYFVMLETFLLLISSITYGMSILAMLKKIKMYVNIWLTITFLCGTSFICMEIYEFKSLIHNGYGPDRSAFLSAFFTLLGTHGLHVIAGLIWIIVMIMQIYYRGLNKNNKIRLYCLSLFWHFLDIIWICIFTIIYLFGVIS